MRGDLALLALLLLATGEGVWIGILLAERRRVERALGEMQNDLRAALDAAERAATAAETVRSRVPIPGGAIGFRP